jgi:xylan 1,4-beta-xylosidase
MKTAFVLSISVALAMALVNPACAQQRTFCNPLNIDYAYCAIPDAFAQGKHRATADPVIVRFKDRYFLFSTNQYGYWWSRDLSSWNFIPRRFLKPYHTVPDELCAPAAVAIGDSLLLLGSTYTHDFPIWFSTDPTKDSWKEAIDSLSVAAWDPDLFLDDDGRLYLYHGSSNVHPIYGLELDRKSFLPIGQPQELLRLNDSRHGWERFGEHGDNTFLPPFVEGAWMTKHHGTYYLQYAAPGTEFSGYADGVYVSDKPLGPFRYQAHNPFSYKPGGFARGAGHGSTFQDASGNWWHVATTAVSVKNNFERRISIWPAGFDSDGILLCNTAYGDYPLFLPDSGTVPHPDRATGWMLLNYGKPVKVSSTLGGYVPNYAVDEDIKTYWSAVSGDKGEWMECDLGTVCTVRALQINFADQNSELTGKQTTAFHRYLIKASNDGLHWRVLVDKRQNRSDVPHDYVELPRPIEARYVRMENVHVPSGKFALSGFRVFGQGHGTVPDTVRHFVVLRGESERRNAWIKWQQSDDAIGYSLYFGIAPDKLYSSIMVYSANEYICTALDATRAYYFQIEAFNENGVGKKTPVVRVD